MKQSSCVLVFSFLIEMLYCVLHQINSSGTKRNIHQKTNKLFSLNSALFLVTELRFYFHYKKKYSVFDLRDVITAAIFLLSPTSTWGDRLPLAIPQFVRDGEMRNCQRALKNTSPSNKQKLAINSTFIFPLINITVLWNFNWFMTLISKPNWFHFLVFNWYNNHFMTGAWEWKMQMLLQYCNSLS